MKQQAPVSQTSMAPSQAPTQAGAEVDPSGGMGNAAMQEVMASSDTSEPETLLDKIRNGASLTGTLPIDLDVNLGDIKVGVKADVELSAADKGMVSCDGIDFSIEDEATGAVTEMSYGTEGVSFGKVGIDFGKMLSIGVNPEEGSGFVEGGTDAMKLGYRYQSSDDEILHFLTLQADAMDLLFAGALEKAKDEAAEKGISFGVDLGFGGDFEIMDGDVPSLRIESLGVDLNAEVGAESEDGEFGVMAQGGVSIESDYANGNEDDPFTKVVGEAHASLTVTLFGQAFEIAVDVEDESKGTLWEKVAARSRLLEGTFEGAFMHIAKTNQEREGDPTNVLVNDLHALFAKGWSSACDQILAAQGVDPRDVAGDIGLTVYRHTGNVNGHDTYRLDESPDEIRAVIARNEAARLVHERALWKGGEAQIDGDWSSTGEWSGDVDLEMSDGVLIGNYEGGALVGGQDGQWLSGTWTGDDGAEGSFTVQVQDDGERLSGFWKHDGESQMYDWILEKKS